MAIVLGEVEDRSKAKTKTQAREHAVRPSIREVRLVGIAVGRAAPETEGAPVSGRRLTRSGRAYRIEAAQVRTGDGDGDGGGGSLCYVHLSALTEG